MRIIRVKGTGTVSETPNLIVIHFTVKGEDFNYDEAMRKLNERTAILRNDIIKAGFSGDDLKTTNFSVDTKYSYHNNQNIFQGYVAKHDLKLEFDFNRIVLNNLLSILSKSNSKAEYSINFEVKDKEQFKKQLLANSVKDAMEKAEVIAQTANVKLGNILNIIYDFSNVIYRSNVMLENMITSTKDVDIVPEDVEATDYVTMEWQIE
ncbi:MAG: hypothetical protein K0Q49_1660 [Haloplasmataceae bacterium]|nr:hypothetical protein [Haloplasmataceae bacterium]